MTKSFRNAPKASRDFRAPTAPGHAPSSYPRSEVAEALEDFVGEKHGRHGAGAGEVRVVHVEHAHDDDDGEGEGDRREMPTVDLGLLVQGAKKMRVSHAAQSLDFVVVRPPPSAILLPDFPHRSPAAGAAVQPSGVGRPGHQRTKSGALGDGEDWELVGANDDDDGDGEDAVDGGFAPGEQDRKAYADVLKG